MNIRWGELVVFRPTLVEHLAKWSCLLVCSACVGGQSFDDGRDGLEKGKASQPNPRADASVATGDPAEVPSGIAPVEPTPVDAGPEIAAADTADAAPSVEPNPVQPVPASRSIAGVLLLSDAENANAGFLEDPTLSDEGVSMTGGWYTDDDTQDCPMEVRPGSVAPSIGMTFTTTNYAAQTITPFPAESDAPNESGLRIWGGGHELWGAMLGISFSNPAGQPLVYDLTKTGAIGVRFWARSMVPDVEIDVKIQDKWSEPSAEPRQCCFLDRAVCGDNSCGQDEEQGCMDAPSRRVSLGTEWTLYELPFSEFVRAGFGSWADGMTHVDEPLAVTEAYQLQFLLPRAEAFDVYFDNIGLILPEVASEQ